MLLVALSRHRLLRYLLTWPYFQSPVAVKVVLPVVQDKSEWKLNGQTMNYTLPLSETVANLKTLLQKETGMVPSKQKLFYDVSNISLWNTSYT